MRIYADTFDAKHLTRASRISFSTGLTVGKPRFQASADRAMAFFKRLRIPDMPGKPTFAEAGRPWQFDFVAELFGGQNPDTLAQTIREAFLCVAKKNYKSGMGAGILLTAAHLQQREEDELSLLAGTKKAARSAFRTMVGMVRATEGLAEQYKINNTSQQLKHKLTNTEILVLALDNASAAGSRSSFVLIDELWTMGTMAKAEGALLEATGGLASRPEGFIVTLTTQSDEPPAGVFKAKLDYARKVKSGEIKDPSFLSVIYEPPPGFDWRRDIKGAIEYANPNLGASTHMDDLLAGYEKVKDDRTGKLQKWLSKYINLEIGQSARADNWAGAEFWGAAQIDLTLDELLERSEVVTLGIDGGGLDDLLALYAMGRERDTKRKLAWGHAWCNRIVLERRQEIAPRLLDFQAAGELSIVDAGEDVAELADLVAKIRETKKLDKIGCDPYAIGAILEALQGIGVPEGDIVGVSQGWKLGQHIQTTERWLSSGDLAVARQGLTAWCVSNARVEQRSNGILITKQASGKAKIDAVVALVNCAALMSQNPAAKGPKKLVFFSLG